MRQALAAITLALSLLSAACGAAPDAAAPPVAHRLADARYDQTCGNWKPGFVAWSYPEGETGPEPGGDQQCAGAAKPDRFGAPPAVEGTLGEWNWWCCPPGPKP